MTAADLGSIDVHAIEACAAATSGLRWELAADANGDPVVDVIRTDLTRGVLRLTREVVNAGIDDVRFVAFARADTEILLKHLRGQTSLNDRHLAEIARRYERASPAPWIASLESQGGLGGCNVISVTATDDDQPDLYLWFGDQLAPDGDWEFVAAARQDIPGGCPVLRGTS
jgi:hypothetical protein